MDLKRLLNGRLSHELQSTVYHLFVSFISESRAVKMSDKLICLTPKDAEFCEAVYHCQRPNVVQSGVSRHAVLNEVRSQGTVGDDSMSVGFLGNYDHYPNLDGVHWYLDHVHLKVLSKNSKYKFYIFGRGPLENTKRRYENLSDSVIFVGEVESIVNALSGMRVCVSPLISGAGFRGKINQYSILKKPTVTTAIGCCGMPYVNGVSAYIATNPDEFAEKILLLLTDQAENSRISNGAYNVVSQNYFWDTHIKRLVDVFQK